jgi:alpha 1,3-mannosyltransferase
VDAGHRITMNTSSMLRKARTPKAISLGVFICFASILIFLYHPTGDDIVPTLVIPEKAPNTEPEPVDPTLVNDIVQYFTDFPLKSPHKNNFGELGRRSRILRDWLLAVNAGQSTPSLQDAIEQVATTLFPYLKNSPRNPNSNTPFSDLRTTFEPASTGIIIPTGNGNVRFAGHLIASLRSVLNSSLPIQVAYGGDEDLSPANRKILGELIESGSPLEFLDITTIFDPSVLHFGEGSGGWATKAFAALGTKYEQVILLDADAVFIQPPEALLQGEAYQRTGAFLFHDRLLWQHAFADRHTWWKEQIRRPSATLNKSLVWSEDYAEECDSGVVVLDKSRIDVLVGLLHIVWQNTYEVREEITYKIMYGDKESWWMGLELAGSAYEMEKHYGGIVGWEQKDAAGKAKVCSFVIAHVDEKDRLLWYNGGLLKNKLKSMDEYEVPRKWMVDDAKWQKGATKQDMSCMVGGEVRSLSDDEVLVLERTIATAKNVDALFVV